MTIEEQRRAIAKANESARASARRVSWLIGEGELGPLLDEARKQADEARRERDHLIREMDTEG